VSVPDRIVAGRYRLRERIGGGGMGAVWLADDQRLGRAVAVKQVLPPAGTDEAAVRQQRERALREGRIAARLSHPHAISVYDVALEDGQPWLVMEYLPSRSLAAVLTEDGLLRVDQAAQIGAQVSDALAATHAAGIVHRDVKPANILIGQGGRVEGVVKITDFGISHASGDVTLTQTGQITGTPAFLAPEVAQGYEPGPAADVFSLGATLYTCLEGEPPFGMAGNSLQQLHRVAAGVINPPSRAGAMTEPLLRMLAVDPQERPSMTEVRDELAAIVAGRGGDTTTVLTARTDVARTRPQPVGMPLPPAGVAAATPPDTPAVVPAASTPPAAPPRTLVEAVRPARSSAPVEEPVAEPPYRRRRVAPWVIAAVAVLLVVVGAVWASTLTDPGADTGASGSTSASQTSDGATGTAGSSAAESAASSSPEASSKPSSSPRTSTSPAPTSSGGGGTTLDADNVHDLLVQYHQLVLDDPAAAYEQAGPTLRNAISLQGFEDYWGRFSDVKVTDVQPEDGGDTALATMEFVWPDGSTQVERHRFTFIEQDGRLVLDSDRFVSTIQGRG
jgi:serine/threonine protein kinase